MEREVPRAGFLLHADRRRGVRRQLARGRVELELIDGVIAEGRHDHVPVPRVGQDRMRVRMVRQDLVRRLHGSRRPDRAHRHLVAGIRGAEQEAARAVGGDVRHAVGERPAAECLSLPRRGIDGESRHDLGLAARADVEDAAVGAHRHRRRDPRLGDAGDRHLLHRRQVAALPIELEHDDLVALGIADIDEGGGGSRRCHHRPRKREDREESRPEPGMACVPHEVLPVESIIGMSAILRPRPGSRQGPRRRGAGATRAAVR